MTEDLKDMIVEGLVRQHSRNDIVQAVCERSGLKWAEAEQLVKQVEAERAHAIARGQAPLIIFLSTGTVAFGLVLLNYCFEVLRVALHGSLLQQLLNLADSIYPIGMGWIGLAMIAGGMIGMWKALLRYFET